MLSEFVGHGGQQSVAGVHDSRPDVVEHERTGAVSALGLDVNKANTWRCRKLADATLTSKLTKSFRVKVIQ